MGLTGLSKCLSTGGTDGTFTAAYAHSTPLHGTIASSGLCNILHRN
jgi:hypothetical protein